MKRGADLEAREMWRLGDLEQCFDPALAHGRTQRLPVSSVIDVLAVSHAPERIAQYRRAMQCGERFPPISVVRLGGRFWVADGHKRFSAYTLLGGRDVVVEVWPVPRWLHDQWRQFRNKTRQQLTLLRRSLDDPTARRQLAQLARDTIGHWRRVRWSLIMLARRVRAG